jgi:hypothetical protein
MKSLDIKWVFMGVFLGAFILFILSLSFSSVCVMLISIASYFLNEFVTIENIYRKRILILEKELSQHLLETNLTREL